MKDHYQVVIVGAGANGLGAAYHLARSGLTDVLVLERKYVPYGATGRNGGGVRAQWGTRENVELARESIRAFEGMSAELGFNVWFRQGGYLFLAHDETKAKALAKTVEFHRGVDVPSRMMGPEEAKILVPDLNTKGLVAASYSPTDGIIFPWAVVHGYLRKLKEMGVDVRTFTSVEGFEASGGRIRAVETSRGRVSCDWVVNAAGCWSRDLAAKVGVDLPNTPVRHEILVTEALKPFLDPMIVDLRNGLYLNQDMRGECVAGIGHPHEAPGINFRSSLDFTKRLARAALDLLPVLGDVNMLRQWAGMYDVTPDNKPVLGPSPGLDNFLQLNGASGHGFMIHPVTTRMTADLVLGRKPAFDITPFLVDRFKEGVRIEEEAMVIG